MTKLSTTEAKLLTERTLSTHQSRTKHDAEMENTTLSIGSSSTNLELSGPKIPSDKTSEPPATPKTTAFSTTGNFRELSSLTSIPEVKAETEKMISALQVRNTNDAERESTTLWRVSSVTNLE